MQQDEAQREKRNIKKNKQMQEIIAQRDEQTDIIMKLKGKISQMKMAQAIAET